MALGSSVAPALSGVSTGGPPRAAAAPETRASIQASFPVCPAHIFRLATRLQRESDRHSKADRVQRAWLAGNWAAGRVASPIAHQGATWFSDLKSTQSPGSFQHLRSSTSKSDRCQGLTPFGTVSQPEPKLRHTLQEQKQWLRSPCSSHAKHLSFASRIPSSWILTIHARCSIRRSCRSVWLLL